MNSILVAVIALGLIALVLAGVLFLVSKKFAVKEDPRVGQVAEVLPQANCGGCGYPGCSGFAAACVKAGSLENLRCPVGGQPVMDKVASILGLTAEAAEPKVAVVRCNGTCEHRPRIVKYDGAVSCKIAHATGGGETGCSYGCLGCGDCVDACNFDAIHINPETGIPEVDEDKCTACGACTKACPRSIIELRRKGRNGRRMAVSCVNKDKGAVTRKACEVGCIGCGICEKNCPFGAITIENNLAYIHDDLCKVCRKCEDVCPQHAIISFNLPPRKPKVVAPKPAAAAAKPATSATEAPKAETPKAEAPKAEAPKAEAPKAEAPKAEAPKVEAPKAEAPKAETPKVEAPKAETPKVEAPKAEAPKAEAPKVEAPKAEAPKAEASKAETPKVEAPKAEALQTETKETTTPKAETTEAAPAAEASKAE